MRQFYSTTPCSVLTWVQRPKQCPVLTQHTSTTSFGTAERIAHWHPTHSLRAVRCSRLCCYQSESKFDAKAVGDQARWARERCAPPIPWPARCRSGSWFKRPHTGYCDKLCCYDCARYAATRVVIRGVQYQPRLSFYALALQDVVLTYTMLLRTRCACCYALTKRLELMPQNEKEEEEKEEVVKKQDLFDAFPDMEDVIDE
eukprot:652748-Rhodomonas_salina.3